MEEEMEEEKREEKKVKEGKKHENLKWNSQETVTQSYLYHTCVYLLTGGQYISNIIAQKNLSVTLGWAF